MGQAENVSSVKGNEDDKGWMDGWMDCLFSCLFVCLFV